MLWNAKIKISLFVACGVAFFCFASCKTVKLSESQLGVTQTTLIVAQSAGQATLSWQSKTGEYYTVMYTDNLDGKKSIWKVLPQYEAVPGTGNKINLTDTTANASMRFYRLQIAPEQKK